jgi:SAM-dependent methyltransferase
MRGEQSQNKISPEDEIFCLKFELDALANLTVRGEAERWVPGYIWRWNEVEHVSRYKLALSHVRGKRVLDMACGSGYGSYLLASEGGATEVIGGDLDEHAIRYGNLRYFHPDVHRSRLNAQEYTRMDYFDVAVSFETIEHLEDYNTFLANIYTSLKPSGLFLVSTPIVDKTTTACSNPYHKIEWSFEDFHKLIGKRFSIETTYIQSVRKVQPPRSLATRVMNRISGKTYGTDEPDRTLKLHNASYKLENIIEGYQLVICRKI